MNDDLSALSSSSKMAAILNRIFGAKMFAFDFKNEVERKKESKI